MVNQGTKETIATEVTFYKQEEVTFPLKKLNNFYINDIYKGTLFFDENTMEPVIKMPDGKFIKLCFGNLIFSVAQKWRDIVNKEA